MGKAFLYGTGGNSLYYSVVCSTTEPAKKEGRIWVKSAVEMTKFEVGRTWATAKVGAVLIEGTPGGPDPESTNKILDLINTKVAGVFNRLKLTPTSCKQTQGSARNWVSVDAYVCHSNTWIQFSATRNTPEFTYTGDYAIVDDSDKAISDFATWTGNWKIRFLTSGTLTFTNLNGAGNGIDVFLVGGGGGSGGIIGWYPQGGGGSGYTKTVKNITLAPNTAYAVAVGAGGKAGSTGGASKFGSVATANGGSGTSNTNGGNGGSGGMAGGANGGTAPGIDGSDGKSGANGTGGKGQGTTTREFGETSGTLYAGGGNVGGGLTTPKSAANTGNGGTSPAGGAETATGKAGYSGIVIIRNKR